MYIEKNIVKPSGNKYLKLCYVMLRKIWLRPWPRALMDLVLNRTQCQLLLSPVWNPLVWQQTVVSLTGLIISRTTVDSPRIAPKCLLLLPLQGFRAANVTLESQAFSDCWAQRENRFLD